VRFAEVGVWKGLAGECWIVPAGVFVVEEKCGKRLPGTGWKRILTFTGSTVLYIRLRGQFAEMSVYKAR
jgi:hypothetical protein